MRILAIDNDPLILDLLFLCLPNDEDSDGDSQVIRAANTEAAIQQIENAKTPFGCFLVDMDLPGSGGIAFCKTIRSYTGYLKTPIVIMTTCGDPDRIKRAITAGATDFVSKPFDSMELGARVSLAGVLNKTLSSDPETERTLQDLMYVDFKDAFSLDQVAGMADNLAMENQLLRMGPGHVSMSLFAIEVQAAEVLYQSAPAPAFRHYMEAVAEAAAGCLAGQPVLMSYGGRGTFVGAVQGANPTNLHDLQLRLNAKLKDIWGATDNAPEVTVASVSKQRLWTGPSASDMLRGYLDADYSSDQSKVVLEEHGFAKLRSTSAG